MWWLRAAPRGCPGVGYTQGLGARGRRDLGQSGHADGSVRRGGWARGKSPDPKQLIQGHTHLRVKLLSRLCPLQNGDGGSPSPAPPPHLHNPLTCTHALGPALWLLWRGSSHGRLWGHPRAPLAVSPSCQRKGLTLQPLSPPLCAGGSPGSRDPSSPLPWWGAAGKELISDQDSGEGN